MAAEFEHQLNSQPGERDGKRTGEEQWTGIWVDIKDAKNTATPFL